MNRDIVDVMSKKSTEERLLKQTDQYLKKLKMGQQIHEILLENPYVVEGCLTDEDRDALDLYHESRSPIDMESVCLRPWQKKVVDLIDNPSEREVIWIVGKAGNEGKNFLQNYIMQGKGHERVVKTKINSTESELAHILSRHQTFRKDIFLFNLSRAHKDASYGFLESIKDGFVVSEKYQSKNVFIKTPNTVMVFSNSFPDTSGLSKDRWKIFEIVNDDLCSTNSAKRKMTTNFGSNKKPRICNITGQVYNNTSRSDNAYDSDEERFNEPEPDTK